MSAPLPLENLHAARNAVFTELSGAQVVDHYGDPQQEAGRVRAAGGLIDRGYRGLLSVTGPDRETLLQSMTTNDVAKQQAYTAVPGAICTNHGKVQSLFTAIKLPDAFLLDMDPAVRAFTCAHLEKYTIVRDAKTCDVSTECGHVGLYGPEVLPVLAAASGLDETDLPGEAGRVATPEGENGPLIVATNEFGVAGFELIVPRDRLERLWAALCEQGKAREVAPFGFAALEILRIETGRARYGVEVDDTRLLLEAGFTDSVAFDKGCYVGQETLSRIVFRGGLKHRLCGLVLKGNVPEPGTEVTRENDVVGEVVSAVHSPALSAPIALAYLKRTCWEPGTAVQVGDIPATVADLPFV